MKCEKCGATLAYGEKFCPKCGEKTQYFGAEGTINITRPSNYFGCLIPFSVYIDGTYVGQIDNNKTISFNATYGTHKVSLNKADSKDTCEVTISSDKKESTVTVTTNLWAFSLVAKGKIKSVN